MGNKHGSVQVFKGWISSFRLLFVSISQYKPLFNTFQTINWCYNKDLTYSFQVPWFNGTKPWLEQQVILVKPTLQNASWWLAPVKALHSYSLSINWVFRFLKWRLEEKGILGNLISSDMDWHLLSTSFPVLIIETWSWSPGQTEHCVSKPHISQALVHWLTC